jgi:hypothetical protein
MGGDAYASDAPNGMNHTPSLFTRPNKIPIIQDSCEWFLLHPGRMAISLRSDPISAACGTSACCFGIADLLQSIGS